MVDFIVVCLVMVVLFVGSLVLIDVAIQIIANVLRAGEKDQPDPETPPEDLFEQRGDL